jgi:hypothetical protein
MALTPVIARLVGGGQIVGPVFSDERPGTPGVQATFGSIAQVELSIASGVALYGLTVPDHIALSDSDGPWVESGDVLTLTLSPSPTLLRIVVRRGGVSPAMLTLPPADAAESEYPFFLGALTGSGGISMSPSLINPFIGGLVGSGSIGLITIIPGEVKVFQGSLSGSGAIALSPTVIPKLATPTGLTATPGDASVALSWNAVTNATGYTIERSTASDFSANLVQLASGVSGTSYTNNAGGGNAPANGTTYHYRVRATASGYTASDWSAGASATPVAAQATVYHLGETYTANSENFVAISTIDPQTTLPDIDFAQYTVYGIPPAANEPSRIEVRVVRFGATNITVGQVYQDWWLVGEGNAQALGTPYVSASRAISAAPTASERVGIEFRAINGSIPLRVVFPAGQAVNGNLRVVIDYSTAEIVEDDWDNPGLWYFFQHVARGNSAAGRGVRIEVQ